MKQYMQIIGCEIKDNDWMELTLVPLTIVKKKKPSIMDFANGDLEMIQKAISGDVQYKTKVYISINEWNDMKLMIGKHVSLEMKIDE